MPTITDYEISPFRSSWSVVAEATSADATATIPAEPGKRHVLVTVDATYSSSSASGLLTVQSGTTVIAKKYIHGSGALDFTYKGLKALSRNQAISATLSSGGVGITGVVTITGYTVPEI